jgi:hypothetical protein
MRLQQSFIVLTKAVSALAQVELLMVAISGGSDASLTTASHQGAPCIAARAAPRFALLFLLH